MKKVVISALILLAASIAFWLVLTGLVNNFGKPYVSKNSGENYGNILNIVYIHKDGWPVGNDMFYSRNTYFSPENIRDTWESITIFRNSSADVLIYYERPMGGMIDWIEENGIAILNPS